MDQPPYRTPAAPLLGSYRVRHRRHDLHLLMNIGLGVIFVGSVILALYTRLFCLFFFAPLALPGLSLLARRRIDVYPDEVVVGYLWPLPQKVMPLAGASLVASDDGLLLTADNGRLELLREGFASAEAFDELKRLLQGRIRPHTP